MDVSQAISESSDGGRGGLGHEAWPVTGGLVPCSLVRGCRKDSGPRRVGGLTSGFKDPRQEDMVSLANLTSVE